MIVNTSTANPLGKRPMNLLATMHGLGLDPAPTSRVDNRIALVANGDNWYAVYPNASANDIALLADPSRQKVIYDQAAVNALIAGKPSVAAPDITYSIVQYVPGQAPSFVNVTDTDPLYQTFLQEQAAANAPVTTTTPTTATPTTVTPPTSVTSWFSGETAIGGYSVPNVALAGVGVLALAAMFFSGSSSGKGRRR